MPDPAVPVAAPDVVERLQRQLTIPLSIMGGESYVLDTDDVREATAEITRLRARVAELEAERAGVDDFRLMLAKLVHRLRQRPDLPAKEMIEQAADLLARKGGASILRSTPDPRDARIAELEAALREVRDFDLLPVCDVALPEIDMVKWDKRRMMEIARRALGDGHG